MKAGLPVEIALDVRPGEIFPGVVKSIGWGVDVGETTALSGLPTIRPPTGWLRGAALSRAHPVRDRGLPERGPLRLAGERDRLHRSQPGHGRARVALDPRRELVFLPLLRPRHDRLR